MRLHEIPKALRAEPRQRVLDLDRAAQPQHIRVRIGTRDARPAGIIGPAGRWVMLVAVPVGPVRSVGRHFPSLSFLATPNGELKKRDGSRVGNAPLPLN